MVAVTAALTKVARSVETVKVPHMLYEQLQWVKKSHHVILHAFCQSLCRLKDMKIMDRSHQYQYQHHVTFVNDIIDNDANNHAIAEAVVVNPLMFQIVASHW